MGMYAEDLREFVIRPTLLLLNDYSPGAENLLLGTAAQESHLGFSIRSHAESGLGLYRISAETHIEVWDKYLVTDPETASSVRGLASQQQFLKTPHNELISNLSYATAIAWMIYKRNYVVVSDNSGNYELAKYWLDYYCKRDRQCDQTLLNNNTLLDQFMGNYEKFVASSHKHLAA